MGNPFGTVITSCPHCREPIGEQHPYSWCAECGEPLPGEIKDLLPMVPKKEPHGGETSAPPLHPEINAPRNFSDIAFSYTGRIPRSTFWQALGLLLACHIVVGLMVHALHQVGLVLLILWLPLLAWVSLAVQVKRWHDLGVTGWAVLVNLVPIVNVLVILIALGMMRGAPDANEYGASPHPARVQTPGKGSAWERNIW